MTDISGGGAVNAGKLTREDVGDSIAAQAHLPRQGPVRTVEVGEYDGEPEVYLVIYDVGYDGLESIEGVWAREADAEAWIAAQKSKHRYTVQERVLR